MRKTLVLGGLMLAVLALNALMPVVKATIMYYWDSIGFVAGIDYKYPHPDRDYYQISRYISWIVRGYRLYHYQMDWYQSLGLEITATAVAGAIGVAVGALMPKGGTIIGGIVTIVLAAYITYVVRAYFMDELECIWWWISNLFVDWLISNLDWLLPACQSEPAVAYGYMATYFASYGYLRIGCITFHDPLGVGNPDPATPTDTTSTGTVGGGGGRNYPR